MQKKSKILQMLFFMALFRKIQIGEALLINLMLIISACWPAREGAEIAAIAAVTTNS
jgi:hypothetical protein